MRKRTIVLITTLSIIVLTALAGKIFLTVATANLEKLKTIAPSTPDLTRIKNGTYKGSYACFPVDVEVEVVVKDQEIMSIALLKHRNGQGQDAEVIPSEVVRNQSLQVEAVSGATYSSIVILKAIEDALTED